LYAEAALVLAAAVALFTALERMAAPEPGVRGPPGRWLADLPPDRWIELTSVAGPGPAYRWTHSGAVYARPRNSLILFGADEHLVSFDNAIYELRLDDLRWERHQAPSPAYALRTDGEGRRLAGLQALQPWPMHVYDAMVYDPAGDVVRVFSGPKHSFVPAPGAQSDPAWAYSLASREWRMAPALEGGLPNFFAAGVVYDPGRDTVVGYASTTAATPFLPLAGEDEVPRLGVWELGPDRRSWQLATPEAHHWGWFNAEFDAAHGVMLVFGGTSRAGTVWSYRPGARPGEAGEWRRHAPGGDACPGGFYFPAAYDSRRGVTMVLPPHPSARRNLTCLYDFARDAWTRLPAADLPRLGLNYTMVYAAALDAFVLVSGGFFDGEPTRVWAFRPGPASDAAASAGAPARRAKALTSGP
jgi:hypothetical protein